MYTHRLNMLTHAMHTLWANIGEKFKYFVWNEIDLFLYFQQRWNYKIELVHLERMLSYPKTKHLEALCKLDLFPLVRKQSTKSVSHCFFTKYATVTKKHCLNQNIVFIFRHKYVSIIYFHVSDKNENVLRCVLRPQH